MTNKKKELGKGLRALLSNIENTSNPVEKEVMVKELTSSIAMIPLDKVEVNPFQPRIEFDTDELVELSKSISTHGLIQPITVRTMGGDEYQLISGERRLRASKLAGLKEVPAYIRLANDQEMLEMALIENIQRADLNAIEVAISYQRLMDECKLTHESLSERVGKNRSTITNYVRLLKLPPEIQQSIKKNELSMGHARALAGLTDVAQQISIHKKVIQDQLSVRDLERLIAGLGSKKPTNSFVSTDSTANAELTRISREMSAIFGNKVEIKRDKSGKGQIIIKYNSDNEFNNIYDIIKNLE